MTLHKRGLCTLLALLLTWLLGGCAGPAMSPPPTAAENLVDVRNLDGPTVTVIANGMRLIELQCGESSELRPGSPGVPALPWDVELVQASGETLDSLQVTSPGHLLIRSEGAYVVTYGSGGPMPQPCPT